MQIERSPFYTLLPLRHILLKGLDTQNIGIPMVPGPVPKPISKNTPSQVWVSVWNYENGYILTIRVGSNRA